MLKFECKSFIGVLLCFGIPTKVTDMNTSSLIPCLHVCYTLVNDELTLGLIHLCLRNRKFLYSSYYCIESDVSMPEQ